MNNLNSISEYQKIVFAKGLDELSTGVQNLFGIGELSKSYPFVVFITNLTNGDNIDGNYPIANLWLEGKRLTRFIGIDKNNSEINVGNHTLQLKFNYDTGLIGIYDKNTLLSIDIVQCEFENVDGGTSILDHMPFSINAKDNKFKIRYRFKGSQDTDISNISKSLNFDPINYPDQYFSYNISNIEEPESNDVQYVEYSYLIKDSTYDSAIKFKFESAYSDSVSNELYLKLFLNPTDYNILINGVIINANEILYVENNKEYTIKLNFEPSNIKSYTNHKIYVKLITSNNISIINSNYKEIQSDSTCIFKIQPTDVQFNSSIDATLQFEVKYVLNNDGVDHTYNDLSKTINVIINGEQSDKYFYFGYDNPTDSNFDISLLKNVTDVGSLVLYNGYDDLNDHSEETFYCAIPNAYKDIVKPRWNAWKYDKPNYLECISWFNIQDNITINGIIYRVYIRKIKGNFYGLIK